MPKKDKADLSENYRDFEIEDYLENSAHRDVITGRYDDPKPVPQQ